MKKINPLSVTSLVNAKHFNFMDFVEKAITQFDIDDNAKFTAVVAAFKDALAHENSVYMMHDRKYMTAQIISQDTVRNERYRNIRDAVKLASKIPGSPHLEQANILMGVFELYGGSRIPSLAMDARTGVLTNLVEDLEQLYNTQVEALELTAMLTALKQANEQFKTLIAQRTLADSQHGKGAMKAARRGTDQAYKMLVSAVNLDYYLGADALAGFIDYLNTEIERYRIQIGQGPSDEDTSDDAGGDLPGSSDDNGGSNPGGGTDSPTNPPSGGGSDGDDPIS
ncbi:MAG: hypothetical protein HUJ99_01890 [Bacteroidaceae bacterium]|nr:hypothetical protein [Bacteroidaceae bacterium]